MSDVGCSMLGAGAWGWPREMLWGGRWEGGSCLGTHVRIKDFKIKKIKINKYFGKTQEINVLKSVVELEVGSFSFSSVTQSSLTFCDPIDCSMPGLPVHHQLLEFTQTHIHWISDATQPSHPLLFPSAAFSLSQHQRLFKWVSSSHQVAKVLEFQLQHQSFQRIFRTDFL